MGLRVGLRAREGGLRLYSSSSFSGVAGRFMMIEANNLGLQSRRGERW